jgi:4'-phosphopantetheinyl transferase
MKATPRPLSGEVHLYCLNLPHEASGLTGYERHLSATEAERAELLKDTLVRSRFIAGRGELRTILGGYLNIDPADVQLATGEHGKPHLANSAENLRFNLSHVDNLLIVAVAAGVEVGVDVERSDGLKPVHDMARLVFSQREQEELRVLPASEQLKAFYRCWVRKEACLKACGRGFSLPGSSFDVPVNPAPMEILVTCHESLWHIRDIDVLENYCASLAVESRGASSSPPAITWLIPYSSAPLKCR